MLLSRPVDLTVILVDAKLEAPTVNVFAQCLHPAGEPE